jgi:hypothetical protein
MDDYQADPSGKCRHDGNPQGELFGAAFFWLLFCCWRQKSNSPQVDYP